MAKKKIKTSPPDIVELKDKRDIIIIQDIVEKQKQVLQRQANEMKQLQQAHQRELFVVQADAGVRSGAVADANGVFVKNGSQIRPVLDHPDGPRLEITSPKVVGADEEE